MRSSDGAQDAAGLIAATHEMIAQTATMKFEDSAADGDYAVSITDIDLES